jgi:hypothetical protein
MRSLFLLLCILGSVLVFVSLAKAALPASADVVTELPSLLLLGGWIGGFRCLRTESDERIKLPRGAMATNQISSKDMQELLSRFQAVEDRQLERLEDVETLTDIIREHGITQSIVQFVKKYGTGG